MMDSIIYKKLKTFGKVQANAELAKLTTFKVGGQAEVLVTIEETDQLVKLLNFLTGEGISYLIMSGGSNLLLPDEPLETIVVRVKTAGLKVEGTSIHAEAGASFGSVAQKAIEHSLSGLEWSAGLPGTVGGAVRGNAGAAGGETAGVLDSVEVWLGGERLQLSPNECKFGYRDSIFKRNGAVVLGASFNLASGDPKKSLLQMQEILKKRNGYYPPFPSAGSFFKNISLKNWPGKYDSLPPDFIRNGKVPAGWLIDQSGEKGRTVGGAMVSVEHGNFIINAGGATQADILQLVEEVRTTVYNKFGVELEEEVQIVR